MLPVKVRHVMHFLKLSESEPLDWCLVQNMRDLTKRDKLPEFKTRINLLVHPLVVLVLPLTERFPRENPLLFLIFRRLDNQ